MLIGGDLSRFTRRVRPPPPALAPLRREEAAVDKVEEKLGLGRRLVVVPT